RSNGSRDSPAPPSSAINAWRWCSTRRRWSRKRSCKAATSARPRGRMADLVRPDDKRLSTRRASKQRGPRVEYLAFRLAGDTYAVPIGEVREILRFPLVTEVPRAPREVLGVVSVRGLLVTVIDLRQRLRIAGGEPSRRGRILLVTGAEDEVIGLYVDEVLQ